MNPPSVPAARLRRAFTLIEMLIVMTIIGIVATLIVPALRGVLDNVNLTGSADNVTATFSLARQTAMSRNLPVELRIYKRDNGNGLAWDALALVIPQIVSGRPDEWIGPVSLLNGSVIIDPNTTYSPLLVANTTVPTSTAPNPTAPWTASESSTSLPDVRSLTYVAFRFLADGSTNLPPPTSGSGPWSLSLRNINGLKATGNAPSANYVALVLDANTGRMLVFRP